MSTWHRALILISCFVFGFRSFFHLIFLLKRRSNQWKKSCQTLPARETQGSRGERTQRHIDKVSLSLSDPTTAKLIIVFFRGSLTERYAMRCEVWEWFSFSAGALDSLYFVSFLSFLRSSSIRVVLGSLLHSLDSRHHFRWEKRQRIKKPNKQSFCPEERDSLKENDN